MTLEVRQTVDGDYYSNILHNLIYTVYLFFMVKIEQNLLILKNCGYKHCTGEVRSKVTVVVS